MAEMYVRMLMLVVFSLCLFAYCDALNRKDKGVCQDIIKASRWVSLKVYNRRTCKGKPSCIIKRMQTYKKPVPKCCSGYEYVAANDSCHPICTAGCINGTCISPNKCHCEPPLRLEKHACVQPVCSPACGGNSTCTDTNNCTCNNDFIPINSTHCGPPCLPGYFNDPIDCKPKCNEKCINGSCLAPNQCSCDGGYKKIDNHTCSPTCEPSCVNAACIDPNVCSCFGGYTPENKWKCAPICTNCTHGDCITPGNCECHEGYTKKDGVCQPVCDRSCLNGVCVEPNKCQCNVGHDLDPGNKFNCLPICEPKCVNASCVSPNTCSCLTGYEPAGNNWTCKPRCDECDNGDCIEPNNCQCHHGYEMVHGKCEPKCSKVCQNGVCLKPEVCACFKGYRPSETDRYTCNPICEQNCINSTCVTPGVCECLPDYDLTEVKHVCKPRCKTCVNGDCVAPGVCRCHKGYNHTGGACSPQCSPTCVNSRCTLPDTCACLGGYKKNLTTLNVCYKECEGPCEHGSCDLHGNCTCNRGYEQQNDTCVEIKPVECSSCHGNCTEGACWCDDEKPCYFMPAEPPAEVASSTSLAGLELTWMLGAAVGFLLIVFLLVVIVRIGKRRQQYGNKSPDAVPYGSVVFTVPETLIQRKIPDDNEDIQDSFYEEVALNGRSQEEKDATERLLEGPTDERL